MTARDQITAPVSVGAVGGSGTRVVARLLHDAGIFMGSDLNPAYDNLWFTLLFKRSDWMAGHIDAGDFQRSVDLFLMASTLGLHGQTDPETRSWLRREGVQHVVSKLPMGPRVENLLSSTGIPADFDGFWGWKEPNTQFFLPELARAVPGLRYVHVLRDGFDMALSRNQGQVRNWGRQVLGRDFGPDRIAPDLVLDFWIAANRRTIASGRELLGDRFLLLSYEHLCDHPEREIGRVSRFVGRDISEPLWRDHIRPRNRGRAGALDKSQFSDRQRREVDDIMSMAGP